MAKVITDTRESRELLRWIKKHGTQRATAEALGISQAYLSDLLYGKRGFNAGVLAKLGLRRVVVAARPEGD